MSWQERLIAALTSVTTAVSHGSRIRSDRYVVWQEDGSRSLLSDDRHTDGVITGSVDLYSKRELDPWAVALAAALDAAVGISYEPISVGYEEETGFWHWSWDWDVID